MAKGKIWKQLSFRKCWLSSSLKTTRETFSTMSMAFWERMRNLGGHRSKCTSIKAREKWQKNFNGISCEYEPLKPSNVSITFPRELSQLKRENVEKCFLSAKKPSSTVPGVIPPTLIIWSLLKHVGRPCYFYLQQDIRD